MDTEIHAQLYDDHPARSFLSRRLHARQMTPENNRAPAVINSASCTGVSSIFPSDLKSFKWFREHFNNLYDFSTPTAKINIHTQAR